MLRTAACFGASSGCTSNRRSHRRTEARRRQLEQLEPKRLDFSLPVQVVRKEVTGNPHPIVRHGEVSAEEAEKETNHIRVRIREPHRVSVALIALGPVEHHSCRVVGRPDPRQPAALLLVLASAHPRPFGIRLPGFELSVVVRVSRAKALVLRLSQLDVADPQTDRRDGDANQTRDLLDRTSFFTPQPPSFSALARFQYGQQPSGRARRKRAAGIEPASERWKRPALPLSYARGSGLA
jgi:hypothetical protein